MRRSLGRSSVRFTRIARATLPQEIAQELISRIQDGSLRPGDPLPPERELAAQLGVARTSLREALKALALVGIVEVRHGDGTFIATADSTPLLRPLAWRMLLSPARVAEVTHARVLIEGELAAQAALHRDDAALAELEALLAAMEQIVDADPFDAHAFLEADLAFHLAVARAAQCPLLQEILVALRSLLHSFIMRSLELEGRAAAALAVEHHREIVARVRCSDAEGARRAMTYHLETKGAMLGEALQCAGTQPARSP
jgi:DNA-binding FadR family transcriptional regulator